MRRLLMLVVSAAMLAGLAVAVPSVAVPETAPQAEAATNVAYINYGEWNCAAATGRWEKPRAIQVSITPGGPGATRIYVANSWVKVSDVFLRPWASTIVAELTCGSGWNTRYITVSAVRYFQFSGHNMWI
jgi:hypothetical protein